jgi:hypothetical protein
MKIISSKIYQSAFLFTLVFSSSLSFADYTVGNQPDDKQKSMKEREALVRACGHYDEVGPSSIFGLPSEYNERYPGIGTLSAEIDRTGRVKPETRKFVQETFQDAKDKWERLDYSLDKNRKLLKRSEKEVNTTAKIKDDTMQFFSSSQGKLAEEKRFVIQKAQKESISRMKADKERLNRDTFTPSSWDQLGVCRDWWIFEQSEIPEWQKDRLKNISGKNHGYGVEQQYGNDLSSNKNAENQAGRRFSDRSANFSNDNVERFQYNYESQRRSGSSPSNQNGGLEMQW